MDTRLVSLTYKCRQKDRYKKKTEKETREELDWSASPTRGKHAKVRLK